MWTIKAVPVTDPEARQVLRDYFDDVASRYYGRPVTAAELDAAMADEPSDDLVPPTGLFLLARSHDAVTGCVGIRVLDVTTAELTRLFVRPSARGRGGGDQLLRAAEAAAQQLGVRRMRLDTRRDLVEARGLYAKHGYREIEAPAQRLYADHWFEKQLTLRHPGVTAGEPG
ncbi:GNAT family N-acetyltransferase [Amycolatopsis thermophila]|uniref:GNAT superfamily N-acetyltransferase n=1 Tax=Amycolatopsis thermophila TaxID=206084 RepID=A0ABU0EWF8_9PSEU|nr:GNAT family N-acetyltransferase [Amycolatopsis thermophila]MDQ0379617.1 GNAT superfamily N-acetyltransferase [Amycolatopsis thermophila]